MFLLEMSSKHQILQWKKKVCHSSSSNLLDPSLESSPIHVVQVALTMDPLMGPLSLSLSLSLSLFLSHTVSFSLPPHALLSLMDRWHPIVYWAKVQCLIGHSSGNWASVSA